MGSNQAIKEQLQAYKRKYYTNRLLKGTILFSAFCLTLFIAINVFEFSLRLNGGSRAIVFYSFLTAIATLFVIFVAKNIYLLKYSGQNISNEQAAIQIGNYFPEISDKLLNIIQLEKLNHQESELLIASIQQKSIEVSKASFTQAVDYSENKKYVKYAVIPLTAIILLLLFTPELITDSSSRILNYNTEYLPEAPFSIDIDNNQLTAFKGENYDLRVSIEGNSIPQNLYIWNNNRKVKANKTSPNTFQYTFNRLQTSTEFSIEAENVASPIYTITVVSRPSLDLFYLELDFPRYLNMPSERIENSGNLAIPEGTKVTWNFNTQNTDNVSLQFEEENKKRLAQQRSSNEYTFNKKFIRSSKYSIQLQNEFSTNRDSLIFGIEAIKDRYPEIKLDRYQDTVLFQSVVLGGNISDDYGFSSLSVFFKYNNDKEFTESSLPMNTIPNNQSYYKILTLDSSRIRAGTEFQYYAQVTDNDGVNGAKSVKTATYTFKIPSLDEIEDEIDKSSQQVQNEIDKTLKEAKELNQKLTEVDERLKTKKELDWQDEKMMQDILKQKEKLANKLNELKKENKLNNLKKEQFSPQNEKIQEKMRQLQELMNNVLDDETKKMYDELKQLLEEKADITELREQIEQMKNEGGDLEQELERTLELFKKLQFDMKLDQSIKALEQSIVDQKKLLSDTENKQNQSDSLSNRQKQLQNKLDDLEEKMNELRELNQERKNPDALPKDLTEQFDEIKEEQQTALNELDKETTQTNEEKEERPEEKETKTEENQSDQSDEDPSNSRSKAQKAQKKASDKMEDLKKSLQAMQSGGEQEQVEEDLAFMKELVDNLVTLSFNQESLMTQFREVRESDPRYVDLSQEQLKLKDDSKIIQDSLVALSQRVFQISSFVMRELSDMNRQMDGSLAALKEKRVQEATGKQQFTMTAINNLALLLDDIVQQMQNQMAGQKGKGKKSKNKPMPGGLSDLQKQLSEQIKELQKSGKSGRQLSEQLAKLAAEQERLRNALENFEPGIDGNGLGDKIDRLIDQMEQNEEDLINKNLTKETVERQQEILTRLLVAENAINERGQDDERKGETAYKYELSIPASLNEYLKEKEKEIELLKTIPAKLNLYYKGETNKYFKKIKRQN
ncbi:MAG: hypothetical protein ACJAR3_001396 [Roseivirga sp.]|jgi:hypothetical protein